MFPEGLGKWPILTTLPANLAGTSCPYSDAKSIQTGIQSAKELRAYGWPDRACD